MFNFGPGFQKLPATPAGRIKQHIPTTINVNVVVSIVSYCIEIQKSMPLIILKLYLNLDWIRTIFKREHDIFGPVSKINDFFGIFAVLLFHVAT